MSGGTALIIEAFRSAGSFATGSCLTENCACPLNLPRTCCIDARVRLFAVEFHVIHAFGVAAAEI